MNETESLSCITIVVDDRGETTVFDPEVDAIKDLSPEMQAKLIALNERFRLRAAQGVKLPFNRSDPKVN